MKDTPAPFIDPRADVSPQACIGLGCRVASGAVLGAGVVLDEGVIVGANAVFIDPVTPAEGAPAQARKGVRVGANAVVHAGVVLAAGAEVRPGAVVTRSVPPGAIVEGNPATITGYVDAGRGLPDSSTVLATDIHDPIQTTPVRGVTVHRFPVIPDLRGNLTVGEFGRQLPFTPLRYFMVFDVPSRETRGEHAHKQCEEFLICVRGNCAVVADDGQRRVEVLLDEPQKGIYLPPMVWRVHYRYSPDAMLLVFASHYYDTADYIRNYDDFLLAVATRRN